MVLLGHAVDDAGFVHLTRGYQTDHLAEVSLEFVWCLQPHCPASTLDWQRQPYRAVAAMREAQLATGDYAMPLSLGLELLTTFSRHVYDAPPKVAKKAAAAKPAATAASAAPASQ